MTDKIIAALIAHIETEIEDVPVVFGETHEETQNPSIVVKVDNIENHSRAIFNAKIINVSIQYRNHAEDETEETQTNTVNDIEDLIFNPDTLKTALNTIIEDGVIIDHIQFTAPVGDWDEQTYTSTFQGVCVAQKV